MGVDEDQLNLKSNNKVDVLIGPNNKSVERAKLILAYVKTVLKHYEG